MRRQYTLNLDTSDEIEAAFADFLETKPKGGKRSAEIRRLALAGFALLVQNKSINEARFDTLEPDMKALLLSMVGGAGGMMGVMPSQISPYQGQIAPQQPHMHAPHPQQAEQENTPSASPESLMTHGQEDKTGERKNSHAIENQNPENQSSETKQYENYQSRNTPCSESEQKNKGIPESSKSESLTEDVSPNTLERPSVLPKESNNPTQQNLDCNGHYHEDDLMDEDPSLYIDNELDQDLDADVEDPLKALGF